jgi:hypothetical protein
MAIGRIATVGGGGDYQYGRGAVDVRLADKKNALFIRWYVGALQGGLFGGELRR